MFAKTVWPLLLSCGGLVNAQFVSNCPSGTGSSSICYSINVPSSSASSGSGDIFFQLKGPTSRSWIALGQGTGMAGSNIFVMYPNQGGDNVTVSPRSGQGHFEPNYNSGTQLTLLDGSGISNGIMTANVKCSNCNTWSGGSMSYTDSSSSWIWASAEGSSLNSNSPSQNIDQHDEQGTITFDLTKAVSTSSTNSANPFVASSSGGSGSGGSGSGSPSSSPNGGNVGSSSSSSSFGSIDFAKLGTVRTAHATVLSLSFLFFFPLGALIIRAAHFRGTIWAHAGVQLLSYALAIAGMGMGIWMALSLRLLTSYHAIIGLVTVSVLVFQAPLGVVHHYLYKKRGGRTVPSYVHVWLGRALITLGAINGAFGLTLAGNSRQGLIAYGTLAGVIYVGYYAVIALTRGGKREGIRDTGEGRVMKERRWRGDGSEGSR